MWKNDLHLGNKLAKDPTGSFSLLRLKEITGITKNLEDLPSDLTLAVEEFQGGWLINSRANCCAIGHVYKKSSRNGYRGRQKAAAIKICQGNNDIAFLAENKKIKLHGINSSWNNKKS